MQHAQSWVWFCLSCPAGVIVFFFPQQVVIYQLINTVYLLLRVYLFLFFYPFICFTVFYVCRFARYKVPDGKPENKFALDEKCMGRQYAMKVVSECHMAWRNLLGKAEQGDVKSNLSVSRLSDMGSDIELETAAQALEGEEGGEGEGEGGDAEEDGEYPTSLIA